MEATSRAKEDRHVEKVKVRPYLSPTLVLLAFDWADGSGRDDFLGFAVQREPGFGRANSSWLPNRIGFDGPARGDRDFDSVDAPIQRFQWWDARIDDKDRGKRFKYSVWPVVGTRADTKLVKGARATCTVTLPDAVEDGIGTWFNRAVVSSQAFSKKFLRDGHDLTGSRLQNALRWLGNGMQLVVPDFLAAEGEVDGAIYHLTDDDWIIPAFKRRKAPTSLDYDATAKAGGGAEVNAHALEVLAGKVDFHPRTRAKIMHDKFLVRSGNAGPEAVLMGSANFTTEGLATQANVIHTWESPKLAALYLKRKQLLEGDPTIKKTAESSGWSAPVSIADARVRVFFSPEPTKARESIDTIVDAIKHAKSSVVFCLFAPTDAKLRHALFGAGDRGLMMFGLLNSISKPKPGAPGTAPDAGAVAQVETYKRSIESKDVYSHALFPKAVEKSGFWFEVADIPGQGSKYPVYIHHKFIVIDAETKAPTIYTGSANMSAGSLHSNDENLLEIKGRPALARTYLAEFMRLYEHYRARAHEQNNEPPGGTTRAVARATPCHEGFALAGTGCWAEDDYKPGTPEFKSRLAMAGEA
jgi:hypothetical protein